MHAQEPLNLRICACVVSFEVSVEFKVCIACAGCAAPCVWPMMSQWVPHVGMTMWCRHDSSWFCMAATASSARHHETLAHCKRQVANSRLSRACMHAVQFTDSRITSHHPDTTGLDKHSSPPKLHERHAIDSCRLCAHLKQFMASMLISTRS